MGKIGIPLLLIAALFLSACSSKNENPQEQMQQQTPGRKFIEAFGIVKAENLRNINITFTSRIEEIFVKEGQAVKKGDKLMQLDLSEFKGEILRKELELAEAEYELEKIKIGNYNMNSSAANVQTLKNTARKYELELLKNKLNQDILDNNMLISNIDNGVVSEISYIEGDYLTTDKKVLTIYDVNSYIVQANVPEEFIKDVKENAEVEIIPSAYPEKTYKGTVQRIAELASDRNGETVVPVDIKVTDNDGTLWPNFNVDIKIYTDDPSLGSAREPSPDSAEETEGDTTG